MKNKKLIILGSGPAGCTAAIYAARANLNPILVTGMNPGGQLCNSEKIENWPGDFKRLDGKTLMERMMFHVKKFNVSVKDDSILRVNLHTRPFLLFGNNYQYACNTLVIATGSSARYLNIESEKEFRGKGVSTCAICDGFFYRNKIVAVVGGGNTAIEEAIYLSNIAKTVFVVHRRNTFRAEKILIDRMMKQVYNGNIILHTNCVVSRILGKNNRIKSIEIENNLLKKKKKILLDGLFIAIGQYPNTSLFVDQLVLDKYGYITVGSKKYKTSTSVSGIFAAGDVTDSVYRQAITSAGMGCMAALDARKYLCEKLSIKK